jgi:hypothetical protein
VPGIEARMPTSFGCLAVSQTLTVAHRRSTSSAGRAAALAGAAAVDERSRAAGLHQALYVVPVLSAVLTAVLFAASRTVGRDRRALLDWMTLRNKDLETSA